MTVGDFCRPCDCNGNADPYHSNWCDHRTGQCLKCLGNTAGWKCDRCLDGYYGNPLSGECKGRQLLVLIIIQVSNEFIANCTNSKINRLYFLSACNCNQFGSSSEKCDPLTGQCPCKEKYVGRTCSRCKVIILLAKW